MKHIVENWSELNSYNELNVIRFFDSCYILTNPNRTKRDTEDLTDVKVIPIRKRVISNGISEISNDEFVDQLRSEIKGMNVDERGLWKQL